MGAADEMLSILDGGGRWIKGQLTSGDSFCLIGAWERSGINWVLNDLTDIIEEQYPDRVSRRAVLHPIVAFNDHPDTTWEDIELVLGKLSVKEEEKL